MDADEGDAEARIATGIRDQLLIIEGWFASHADSGTPGPHVHLRTSDARDAVVRTDQVPDVIEGLVQVAERIGRLWESHGEHYTDEVLRHSPDPNDPEVMQQEQVRSLQFAERASARMPDVIALLTQAESTDEALESIARFLDVDEAEAMVRLARFDLLSLTRPAQAARAKRLAALRDGDAAR